MPKKSRAQEAALGQNLEPLYTALVPPMLPPPSAVTWVGAYCPGHGCGEKCGIHKRGSHEVPTGTIFTAKPEQNPIPKDISGSIGCVSESWLPEEFHRSFAQDSGTEEWTGGPRLTKALRYFQVEYVQ
ncbi:hypothetical protein B0H13DRAFT_1869583 [Mycena leptocephala]|nr:hypothetical protein B0H13DRAFT_1869583 [Mycena leptocephala]